MSSLQINNLSKSFGRLKALDDLSLSVADGEFLVLLGPTAAGKTTTLRCLAGLEKPENGTVIMDDEVIDKLSPAERDVALVFQTYALYPRKTVYENMAFPLKARDLSRSEIDTRITQIATKLRIDTLMARRPAQLSGGQQQRVALGRAMVRDPRIFLMDEPLTNLDFSLRVEMRAELKRLQKELKTTFFYVTNDQVEAMSMADRIAVLNKGVLQQVDAPEAIYDHPANLFVAQFIGSPMINTLHCQLDKDTRQLIGTDRQWHMPLSISQMDKLTHTTPTASLLFGIRSEDVEIVPNRQDETTLSGEVYVIEPLGDRTYVDVRVGGESIKVRAAPTYESHAGHLIWLQFNPDRFHVFDEATGRTLI